MIPYILRLLHFVQNCCLLFGADFLSVFVFFWFQWQLGSNQYLSIVSCFCITSRVQQSTGCSYSKYEFVLNCKTYPPPLDVSLLLRHLKRRSIIGHFVHFLCLDRSLWRNAAHRRVRGSNEMLNGQTSFHGRMALWLNLCPLHRRHSPAKPAVWPFNGLGGLQIKKIHWKIDYVESIKIDEMIYNKGFRSTVLWLYNRMCLAYWSSWTSTRLANGSLSPVMFFFITALFPTLYFTRMPGKL